MSETQIACRDCKHIDSCNDCGSDMCRSKDVLVEFYADGREEWSAYLGKMIGPNPYVVDCDKINTDGHCEHFEPKAGVA